MRVGSSTVRARSAYGWGVVVASHAGLVNGQVGEEWEQREKPDVAAGVCVELVKDLLANHSVSIAHALCFRSSSSTHARFCQRGSGSPDAEAKTRGSRCCIKGRRCLVGVVVVMRELCLEVVQQRVPEPQKRSLCLLRRGAGAVEALEHSVDDLLAPTQSALVSTKPDTIFKQGKKENSRCPSRVDG
eukprot:3663670-Rhodomonas_salina.2